MSFINYKIIGINIPSFFVKKFDEKKDVDYNSSFKFALNYKDRFIACICNFNYFQDENEIMSIEQETIFEFSKSSLSQCEKDGIVEIPVDILQYLATISVGTARGEIHGRCEREASNVSQLILPPINLTEIITKASIFKL